MPHISIPDALLWVAATALIVVILCWIVNGSKYDLLADPAPSGRDIAPEHGQGWEARRAGVAGEDADRASRPEGADDLQARFALGYIGPRQDVDRWLS